MKGINEMLRNAMRGRIGLVLLLGVAARGASAGSVYKCRDARGHVAYQDHACADTQQQTQIDIAPAPSPSPSPQYNAASHGRTASKRESARTVSRHAGAGAHELTSYECRASNGDVFYRHSGCPKSIRASGAAQARGNRKNQSADAVSVSAVPMTRSEACRRQASSGLGRAGHEHDDQVSTYDRNAGRDPCRHF